MTPPTASEVAPTHSEGVKKPTHTHPEQEHAYGKVPAVEEPILKDLFAYRHSLQHLRKASHGAITLADVDAKANELALIMHRLRQVREAELEGVQRNRVDDILDSIWLILFYIWGKIAAMDESLYPVYVHLVSITRTADALRASGEWTNKDVQPLQERLIAIEEQVVHGSDGIKFLDPKVKEETQAGDHIPRGQAILTNLLNRAHRAINFLNAENDTIVEHLRPVQHELNSILAELDELRRNSFEDEELKTLKSVLPYTVDSLASLSDRLHAIDAARGPTGRFNAIPSHADPPGHASCCGLLALCYDRLSELLTNLDSVPESSPLKPFERTLLEILAKLDAVAANKAVRGDPTVLSQKVADIQHDLSAVDGRRNLDDGSFVPHGDSYQLNSLEAAILQGQARLHSLLKQCHKKITDLVDPVCRPVSETLMSTYESLILLRARLHSLRREALAVRNPDKVRKGLEEASAQIKTVEGTKVRGLFRGHAAVLEAAKASAVDHEMRENEGEKVNVQEEDLLAWLTPQSKTALVPEGQAAVSALLDECESLVWETKCLVEFRWG
ncbi:hypothetical protein HDU97_005395 [Phlyctochytrium planicorne]|nr:hypothetical protein HDU97_005395 [Phlyctochytrium planicorne]